MGVGCGGVGVVGDGCCFGRWCLVCLMLSYVVSVGSRNIVLNRFMRNMNVSSMFMLIWNFSVENVYVLMLMNIVMVVNSVVVLCWCIVLVNVFGSVVLWWRLCCRCLYR